MRDHDTSAEFLCPSCSDDLWFGHLNQTVLKCWCLRCGLSAQLKGDHSEVFAAICYQHKELIQKTSRSLAA